MSNPSDSLPAVLGGEPVRPAGPPDWPVPDDDVHAALEAAYASGDWGKYHGPHVERLESELARYHGVDHVLTCASGTFAMELALRALKIGADDEVILAAYDFSGNFLDVLAVGARPVLVDVDRGNWNMAVAEVERAIGPRTKAIIVSHLHGGVVPIREVVDIARRRGIAVIEDAAQMPGAWIDGRRAGTWGDIGILSFGGSKLFTAGRGGALISASREIHHRAKLASHRGNQVAPLSELQAAVLLPQLAKLDARNAHRTESVRRLRDGLRSATGLWLLENADDAARPGYYKVGFQYDSAAFAGLSRDLFVSAMRVEGIAMDAGFRSLHIGRSASRFRAVGALGEADRAHHGMIVLHHPVLLGSEADVDEVLHAVRRLHAQASELIDVSRWTLRASRDDSFGE